MTSRRAWRMFGHFFETTRQDWFCQQVWLCHQQSTNELGYVAKDYVANVADYDYSTISTNEVPAEFFDEHSGIALKLCGLEWPCFHKVGADVRRRAFKWSLSHATSQLEAVQMCLPSCLSLTLPIGIYYDILLGYVFFAAPQETRWRWNPRHWQIDHQFLPAPQVPGPGSHIDSKRNWRVYPSALNSWRWRYLAMEIDPFPDPEYGFHMFPYVEFSGSKLRALAVFPSISTIPFCAISVSRHGRLPVQQRSAWGLQCQHCQGGTGAFWGVKEEGFNMIQLIYTILHISGETEGQKLTVANIPVRIGSSIKYIQIYSNMLSRCSRTGPASPSWESITWSYTRGARILEVFGFTEMDKNKGMELMWRNLM